LGAGTGPIGVAVGAGQAEAFFAVLDFPSCANGLCVTSKITMPISAIVTRLNWKILVRRWRSAARLAARASRLLSVLLIVVLLDPDERVLVVCDGIC
jgi:hypothetical protein